MRFYPSPADATDPVARSALRPRDGGTATRVGDVRFETRER